MIPLVAEHDLGQPIRIRGPDGTGPLPVTHSGQHTAPWVPGFNIPGTAELAALPVKHLNKNTGMITDTRQAKWARHVQSDLLVDTSAWLRRCRKNPVFNKDVGAAMEWPCDSNAWHMCRSLQHC
ncbi:hypothetical protein SKAU_G00359850 [Synaphobranchus kaupii]|uniref:Uncharacterized protein n=1 Tax=Synaphobranchus kaupii TaxID=118154 RepID=A0A9Q1EI09_SYNKA|nr:hypothetical protein SKAU_G00359850 [Synaphobranchus kaupii]